MFYLILDNRDKNCFSKDFDQPIFNLCASVKFSNKFYFRFPII